MNKFTNCLFGLLLFSSGLANAGEETVEAAQPDAGKAAEISSTEEPKAAGKVENHVLAAMPHADAAIEHGAQGHAEVLVEHAQAALTHAEAGRDNPHLAEAATHLQAAIEHGRMGHADVATRHAREAYNHIKAASRQ